jgi:GT2 family glycosyltransferase
MKTEKASPNVCIVILNWNNYQDTLECIRSLQTSSYKRFSVVVVDNGSRNESVEILRRIDGIHLICNAANMGFAGGNNIAMRYAEATGFDYVWLLNSDATVDPTCLERLVDAANVSDLVGLVSPVIFHADRPTEYQHISTRLDNSGMGVEEAKDVAQAKQWQSESPQRITLWGTALLISMKLFRAIGGLDDKLFAYSEDTDYSIRSSRSNFQNVVAFEASIWHGSTTGLRKPHYYFYTTRNVALMWRKHVPLLGFLKICWWNIHRVRRTLRMLVGHPVLVDACKLGWWHGLRGRGGEYNSAQQLSLLGRCVCFLLFKG